MDTKQIIMDLRGDVCPYPLIMAIKKITEIENSLKSGEKTLKFIIDHPPATRSIPREAGKRGYQTELVKTGAAEWEIIVKGEIRDGNQRYKKGL